MLSLLPGGSCAVCWGWGQWHLTGRGWCAVSLCVLAWSSRPLGSFTLCAAQGTFAADRLLPELMRRMADRVQGPVSRRLLRPQTPDEDRDGRVGA